MGFKKDFVLSVEKVTKLGKVVNFMTRFVLVQEANLKFIVYSIIYWHLYKSMSKALGR